LQAQIVVPETLQLVLLEGDSGRGEFVHDIVLRGFTFQFHYGCKVYLGAPAVWVGQSGHNRIQHNEFTGQFMWAVSLGWNWAYFPLNRSRDDLVEKNHIHDLGTGVLGTHGALYCLGVSPGTVLRNNYIHDVQAAEAWGAGEGIILDNGCVGILVENNVVHDAVAGGWGCNFNCLGNIIQNNVLVFPSAAGVAGVQARLPPHRPHGRRAALGMSLSIKASRQEPICRAFDALISPPSTSPWAGKPPVTAGQTAWHSPSFFAAVRRRCGSGRISARGYFSRQTMRALSRS
jgi:hypothetical protein